MFKCLSMGMYMRMFLRMSSIHIHIYIHRYKTCTYTYTYTFCKCKCKCITAGPFLGELISNYSYSRASAGELILDYSYHQALSRSSKCNNYCANGNPGPACKTVKLFNASSMQLASGREFDRQEDSPWLIP